MSNDTNSDLLERADNMMEVWTGTLYEKMIQHAVSENDMEQLAVLVPQAEQDAFDLEYNPDASD